MKPLTKYPKLDLTKEIRMRHQMTPHPVLAKSRRQKGFGGCTKSVRAARNEEARTVGEMRLKNDPAHKASVLASTIIQEFAQK